MDAKTGVGVGLKTCHNSLHLVGQKKIVRVKQGNDLAPAGGKGRIEARCLAAVRLANQAQARILALIFFYDADRVIGRPVVADDEFKIGVCLVEGALNRVRDEAAVVVIGDQNRDQRLRR